MDTPRFRIGNDLTIFWAINNRDGSPYDLDGKEVRLFMTHERGREEVEVQITQLEPGVRNNVIRWDFKAADQRILGTYTLTLVVLESGTHRELTKDYGEAFTLVGRSEMENEEGDANISIGGDLILSTKLDVYRIQATNVDVAGLKNQIYDVEKELTTKVEQNEYDAKTGEIDEAFVKVETSIGNINNDIKDTSDEITGIKKSIDEIKKKINNLQPGEGGSDGAWHIDETTGNLVTDKQVEIKNNLIVGGDTASAGVGEDPGTTGIDEAQLKEYLDENKYITSDYTYSKQEIDNKIPSLDGYVTNEGLTKTLFALNLGQYLKSEDAENTYAKITELKKYLLLESANQTIKGNVTIEGNLVVTGDTASGAKGTDNGTDGTLIGVIVNGTSYDDETNGMLDLSSLMNQYAKTADLPTSLPASDVYTWAKKSSLAASDVPNLSWSKITSGKPTTLAGYGITDALSSSGGTLTNNSYSTVLTLSGVSSSLIEFQQKGTKLGAIGYNSNGVPVAMTGASYVNLIHSGNYSDYALPLSGGTMNLDSTIKWNHANEENWNTTVKGLKILRYASTANLSTNGSFANYAAGLHIANSTTYAFQIAYNAGYGNANYNESLRYRGYAPNGNTWGAWKTIAFTDSTVAAANEAMRFKDVASSGDLNTVLAGGGMARTYSNYLSTDFTNAPSDSRYGAVLQLSTYAFVGLESLSAQLAWDVNHASTTDTTRYLWWRVADSSNVFKYAKWHQIAFTDSNVASATKLQTARTIWGQSFDGTGNVSGSLSIGTSSIFMSYNGNDMSIVSPSAGNPIFGYGTAAKGYDTYVDGYKIHLRYGVSHTEGLFLNESGNVGIGTTSPAYKLEVNGTARVSGAVTMSSTLTVSGLLTANGNAVIKGDTSTGSDIRFKDKIEDVVLDIKAIADMPLFTFRWNDREDDAIHLGSSAQYWEKHRSELVCGEDFKSLNYPVLGAAGIKTIAIEVMKLREEVKQLKRMINHGS